MDIYSLSANLSLRNVQHEVVVRVQKMTMDGARDQGAALVKMLDTVVSNIDSMLGSKVDMLA
ncbi:YjfB family protein [Brucepastera parasyntrophica]|uniref:YjfB family protein n=1 Tax=Brucepastera parasyntrophica TaxID=2880008 RepID=UPI0034E2EF68|nr:YjfB family protein [Brucepastera parasyntrophica]